MKNNELLREEFLQRFFEPTFLDLKPYDNSYKDDEMIHWWLNKIQEARNSIKAELVKGLEGKKKIYDGGSGEMELLFIDPTAVEGYNVGIDEAIELVKKI